MERWRAGDQPSGRCRHSNPGSVQEEGLGSWLIRRGLSPRCQLLASPSPHPSWHDGPASPHYGCAPEYGPPPTPTDAGVEEGLAPSLAPASVLLGGR